MITSIHSARLMTPHLALHATFHSLKETTVKVFEQVKSSISTNPINFRNGVDFRPLHEPWNLVEGAVWVGFWGLSALFFGTSLQELYAELTAECPASERSVKIAKAVKTAFVDLVSLGGATAFNVRWAHETKIISIGQYAPLVKCLGYGASLIVNIVEGGWSIYNITVEKEAWLRETSPAQQEKYRQRLCIALMKLIGNISMIAWTTLGIATVAVGLAVSPILMTALLIMGCVFPVAAFFCQKHIENAQVNSRLQNLTFSPSSG